MDPFDILEEVHKFYDYAWMKLILFIAIIGILWPYVVTWFQRREFRKSEQKTKEDLQKHIDESIKKTKVELAKKIEEIFNISEEKNKKEIAEVAGSVYHIQGNTLEYRPAIVESYLGALDNYTRSDDMHDLRIVLENLKNTLDKCNKEDIQEIERKLEKKIDEWFVLVQNINKNDIFTFDINELKEKLQKARSRKPPPEPNKKANFLPKHPNP